MVGGALVRRFPPVKCDCKRTWTYKVKFSSFSPAGKEVAEAFCPCIRPVPQLSTDSTRAGLICRIEAGVPDVRMCGRV